MNEIMNIETESEAYQDAYEDEFIMNKIKECEDRLLSLPEIDPSIIGVIIGIGDRIVSFDIFASNSLFKKLWPKILKASALSGIISKDKKLVNKDEADNFLAALKGKDYLIRKTNGSGSEMYSFDEKLNVNALIFDQSIIHLSAFPPIPDDSINVQEEFINLNQVDFIYSNNMNIISPEIEILQ